MTRATVFVTVVALTACRTAEPERQPRGGCDPPVRTAESSADADPAATPAEPPEPTVPQPQPQPQDEPEGSDPPPPDGDDCVAACIERSQMQATAPEVIEAQCRRTCAER
jgi:hypothetical protein